MRQSETYKSIGKRERGSKFRRWTEQWEESFSSRQESEGASFQKLTDKQIKNN